MKKLDRFSSYGIEDLEEPMGEPLTEEQISDIDDSIEREEAEVSINNDNMAEIDQVDDEVDTIVETLESLALSIESIIESGTATKQTANLISLQLSSCLANTGLESRVASLESFENDMVAYHQATLEGIGDVLATIGQGTATSMSNRINSSLALFKSTVQIASGFNSKLNSVKAKALNDSKTWTSKEQKLNFAGSHFLVRVGGQGEKIMDNLKEDFEVSQYILTKYPKITVSKFQELEKIIENMDLSSEDSIKKTLLNKIESFKHPVDSFDNKYIGKVYFGIMTLHDNTSILSKMGTAIKRFVSGGDPKYSVLEQKGIYRFIGEYFMAEDGTLKSWTIQHAIANLNPVSATIDGAVGAAIGGQIVSVSNSDLMKIINYGEQYYKLLSEANVQLMSDAGTLNRATDNIVKSLKLKMKDDVKSNKYIYNRLIKLVKNMYSTSLYPRYWEIQRATHVLRSIYNLTNNAVKRAQ